MKFLLIFIFFPFHLFAQNDYVEYYHLLRTAKQYSLNENIDSAILKYDEAFSKVNYVHNKYLKKAIEVYKKSKNTSKVDEYSKVLNARENSINLLLKNKLDSLSKEDQRIRGGKFYKAQKTYHHFMKDSLCDKNSTKYLKTKKLMEEWMKTDSTNIELLKNLIVKYGFPSEKLVGEKTANATFIIILHYDSDKDNSIMKPILDKALKNGKISPENYAWIVDRRLNWGQGKSPYYYFMPMGLEKLSKKEIKEIDKRRYKIGLGGVYEGRKIIKRGKTIVVKPN